MKTVIILLAAIVLAGFCFAKVLAPDDVFTLTDEQAKQVEKNLEEARKKLLEREEKDVELDNID